jgi:hypothetical protein
MQSVPSLAIISLVSFFVNGLFYLLKNKLFLLPFSVRKYNIPPRQERSVVFLPTSSLTLYLLNLSFIFY